MARTREVGVGGQKGGASPRRGGGGPGAEGGRHYCVGGLAGLGLRESLSAGGRRPPLPRRRQRRRQRQLTQPAARAETPLTARGFPVPAPGARGTRPLPPRHWPLRPPPHTYWPARRQSAEAAGGRLKKRLCSGAPAPQRASARLFLKERTVLV
ncbi:uncharacterized protein LOC107399557 isoform X2 [Peromyscus maniculatus bairdii]|uniref:uncharacterized protein LOC107399557 isoform X2 n=1 Tax=Peromyscus maniculatus bairdii TaxID=230844 RepID=UPI003FD30829